LLDFMFSKAQSERLLAARAWWQEGERAFDFLAERERINATFARLHTHFELFRGEAPPMGNDVALLLPLLRKLSSNRALNRTLATDDFARALQTLLFGLAPLAQRLTLFLQTQSVGVQTASQLLYGFAPDRFPLVTDATRAMIAPTQKQRKQARKQAMTLYGLGDHANDFPAPVLSLLGDFVLYEGVRDLLSLSTFAEVNAVLWHARMMPAPARAKRKSDKAEEEAPPPPVPVTSVRETGTGYEAEALEPQQDIQATERDLLHFVENEIARQGFTFPALTVRNYYIALQAKPFVILTGLSGTGKTALTRLFAHALTGGSPEQYRLIAVRPDWNDPSALLGYHNIVTDRYASTPFLNTLRLASGQEMQSRPVFVCLDEMNLARVEHYFADVLSAMETPDGAFTLGDGQTVPLPSNLFLTGSVNSDESTHPFSRKVLDRANTLEFAEVCFTPLEPATYTAPAPTLTPITRQRLFLSGRIPTVQAATRKLAHISPALSERATTILSKLNGFLAPRFLHFGYRVRDEVLRYLAASFAQNGDGLLANGTEENAQTALDLQIVQKVLPRIHGSFDSLDPLLRDLLAWAHSEGFPRTAAKVLRMRDRGKSEGYVTFYDM
jgi:hypothetical protein